MSTDQPVPPSIPPRGRPAAGQAPAAGQTAHAPDPARRPPLTPETVAAAAASPGPAPDRVPSPGRQVPAQGPSPAGDDAGSKAEADAGSGREESAFAGSRARAVAAGGAVRRAVRGATAAAVGAAAGSGSSQASTPSTTGAGRVPRASQTEGDPAMAATETAPRTAPARSGPAPQVAAARDSGPRRVRLNLSRVDPWSVMKLSFLLSFAIGIMIVVAAVVIWFALDSLAVFTSVNDMITEIVGQESPIDILQFLDLSRVVSGAMVIAVVDVVLLTALSTIGAFLYNITAALVGGVNITLTDE